MRSSGHLFRIAAAFRFLTIIPLPGGQDTAADAAKAEARAAVEREIGGSAAWYPLVGVFQGAAAVAVCEFTGRIFPVEIAAALALCAVVLTNGGFHLDGLSDTFDALASRKPRQRKLEIMKDSVAGPIGVTAVVLVLLIKYLALAYLFKTGHAWLSITAFAAGKWAVVPAAWRGESARKDGLGRVIIENTGGGEVFFGGALTVLAMALTAYVFGGGASGFFEIFYKMLAIMPAVYGISYLSVRFCRAKFGGLTGDAFGALIELTEAFVLVYFTSSAWI
jgi:adenosylcobinamide-GDP ribazoletransferase